MNVLLNKRINAVLSSDKSQNKVFQCEEISPECNIVVSDIPGWITGAKFQSGKEIQLIEKNFHVGEYIMLIELPFLIQPKEVLLEFTQHIHGLYAIIQGVQEPWGISEQLVSRNIIDAFLNINDPPHQYNILNYIFDIPQMSEGKMCRYFLVKIFAKVNQNQLKSIRIKRWVPSPSSDQ